MVILRVGLEDLFDMDRLGLNVVVLVISLVIGPVIVAGDWRKELLSILRPEDTFAEFATEFSKVALQENSENFVCSPISAIMPLAMITYGAANETQEQLISSLRIPPYYTKKRSLHESRKIMRNLNSYNDIELYFANKMYVSEKYLIKPQYEEITREYFQSKCESIDFKQSLEAAEKINTWCAKKTHNKINKIVKSADFNEMTSMVLVNAIYFKGSWKKPFNPDETIARPFFTKNKSHDIPTMHQKNHFCYGTIPYLGANFINLPFKASTIPKEINMHILLPSNDDDLSTVEENLHTLRMVDFYRYCESTLIDLLLPTFEVRNTIDLQNYLTKLGVKEVFTDKANFTNISAYPMKVTKVIQQSFIQVNEEGSRAGAATALEMTSRRYTVSSDATSFHVNKPFIVIIATKNHILVTAKIIDPLKTNSFRHF